MFSVKKQAGRLHRRWLASLDEHVIAAAWSPGGTLVAAATVSGPVVLFDAREGKARHRLAGHGFGTTAVNWSADGAHFATAGQDGKVKLWDLAAAQERLALPGSEPYGNPLGAPPATARKGGAAWVERLAWAPAANLLASAAGRKLRLWDPQGRLVREYPDHPSTIADLQWCPNARTLASAAYGLVALWEPESAEALRRFEWKGSILALANGARWARRVSEAQRQQGTDGELERAGAETHPRPRWENGR